MMMMMMMMMMIMTSGTDVIAARVAELNWLRIQNPIS
jgi:hypothetical protein